MNRRIIPSIILSASLPLASFAQYTDLKSAFDAIGAAHREKRYDDALRIAQEARSLAKTDDDRDNIALRVADTYTYQGKFAESLAVSAPIATACTNISSCSHASTGTAEEFEKLGNTKILSWLFWADAKIEENMKIENSMIFIIVCTIDFLKLN